MSKITPLMTSLHEGHKAEERINCIDNMLFKERRCEDTKWTVLQAFWWYRKNSIPLDKVKEAREEIDNLDIYFDNDLYTDNTDSMFKCDEVLEILDKLISESEGEA